MAHFAFIRLWWTYQAIVRQRALNSVTTLGHRWLQRLNTFLKSPMMQCSYLPGFSIPSSCLQVNKIVWRTRRKGYLMLIKCWFQIEIWIHSSSGLHAWTWAPHGQFQVKMFKIWIWDFLALSDLISQAAHCLQLLPRTSPRLHVESPQEWGGQWGQWGGQNFGG